MPLGTLGSFWEPLGAIRCHWEPFEHGDAGFHKECKKKAGLGAQTFDFVNTGRLPKASGRGFRVMTSERDCKRSNAFLRDKKHFSMSWFSLIVARTTLCVATNLDSIRLFQKWRPVNDPLSRWRVGIRAKRPGGI